MISKNTTMGKIEKNKQEKQDKILLAGKDIFLSEGYTHTSMDNIAQKAGVTKQTVYRYFPSKIDLFQAVLDQVGKKPEYNFFTYLENPDTKQGIYDYSIHFLKAHLSDEHVAFIRLLISESNKSPEIIQRFLASGPKNTKETLLQFFKERTDTQNPENFIHLWKAMLLSPREPVLLGMPRPSDTEIEKHITDCCDFLFSKVTFR